MLNFNKKASQSGRSMIEMLGVLAIVGILSAGGIAGYNMAMEKYKTNALIEKVQLIATQARALYKNRADYSDLTGQSLIDSGRITDVKNPFGGELNVRYGKALGKGYFYINTNGIVLPVDACVEIVTTYWGDKDTFWGVGPSSSASNTQFRYNNDTYPITDINDAITVCKNSTKEMLWYFK